MKRVLLTLTAALACSAHAVSEKDARAWRFEMGTLSNKALSPMSLRDGIGSARGATRAQFVKLEEKAAKLFSKTPADEPCKNYARLTTNLFDATFSALNGDPYGISDIAKTAQTVGEWRYVCDEEISKFK